MPASNETALRRFFGRFLGWEDKDAVEHALRSAELAAAHRAALVLVAETDFEPIALALHRVTRGASAPFVLCDPLLGNHANGVAALAAAAGGSLCLRSWRLPLDFVATIVRARDLACDVQIIVGAEELHLAHPFLILPVPIWVSSLQTRTYELPRIVMEYALDAIAELDVPETSFTEADRQWVLEHATMTWAGIQEATLRLVALRASPSLSHAAERLGMAEVTLRNWLEEDRELPPILHDPELRAERGTHQEGAHLARRVVHPPSPEPVSSWRQGGPGRQEPTSKAYRGVRAVTMTVKDASIAWLSETRNALVPALHEIRILRETLLAQMGAGAEFDVRTARIATAIDRVLNYTAEVAKQLDADGGESDAVSSTSGGPPSGTSPR